MKKFVSFAILTLLILPCLILTACSPAQYTVTIDDDIVGGTVSQGGVFKENEVCTLVATPDSGYFLDYWLINGSKYYGEEHELTVQADTTVDAVFTEGVCVYVEDNTDKRVVVIDGSIEDNGSSFKIKANDEMFSYWYATDSSAPISFMNEINIIKSSITAEKRYTAENTLIGAVVGFTDSTTVKEEFDNVQCLSYDEYVEDLELVGFYKFGGDSLNCTASTYNNRTTIIFNQDCSVLSNSHYEFFGRLITIDGDEFVMLYEAVDHPSELGLTNHPYSLVNHTYTFVVNYCQNN